MTVLKLVSAKTERAIVFLEYEKVALFEAEVKENAFLSFEIVKLYYVLFTKLYFTLLLYFTTLC